MTPSVEGISDWCIRAPKQTRPAYFGCAAAGSIRERTVERMPSAPMRTSALASVPSAKCAVMPESVSVVPVSRLPWWMGTERRSASS